MYRIGDYVYCDDASVQSGGNSQNEPYQIRQIEELFKTSLGNAGVEASVVIFYRRREISSNLAGLADRQAARLEEDDAESNYSGDMAGAPGDGTGNPGSTNNPFQADYSELKPDERYHLKHRELFLSKNVERIPATRIRGKCQVNLFCPAAESFKSYLSTPDLFFYRYRYDGQQKSLNYDRNETRIGPEYQAEIPDLLSKEEREKEIEQYRMKLAEKCPDTLPEQVWSAHHNPRSDKEIDQIITIARSVGTFSRALDCTGATVRSTDWNRSGVHMSAAAACRDITASYVMTQLHKNEYDICKTVLALVPASGPILCRDELEDWSPSEAFLFEEALEKHGKDFQAIQKQMISWRSVQSIIEYYYLWKTTDRYSHRKRLRAQNSDGSTNKLKQLFLSTFKDPSPFALKPSDPRLRNAQCDSCVTKQSALWYRYPSGSLLNSYSGSGLLANTSLVAHASAVSAAQGLMTGLLCDKCHPYWKHYGGLKWNNVLNQNGLLSSSCLGDSLAGGTHRDQQQRALLQQCPHCEREFRGRQQMSRHLSFNHGYFGGGLDQHGNADESQVRDNFVLQTSRRTRVARHACSTNSESELVPLRQIWRSRHPVSLSLLERDLACRKGELRSIEIRLMKFRQAVYDKNAKILTAARKNAAGEPQVPLGDEHYTQSERFPTPSEGDLEHFFNGLTAKAAAAHESIASCSIQRSSHRYARRPKLLPKPSAMFGALSRPAALCPAAEAAESKPAPPVQSEPLCYIEGIDGVFVASSLRGRAARRKLPIHLLRRCARHPWYLMRNDLVCRGTGNAATPTEGDTQGMRHSSLHIGALGQIAEGHKH